MQFTYQARTPEGEPRSGTIEARSPEGAIEILQRNNLIVISVGLAGEKFSLGQRLKFFDRISPRDVVIFSRQLSTLFEAKVPILTSLQLFVLRQK